MKHNLLLGAMSSLLLGLTWYGCTEQSPLDEDVLDNAIEQKADTPTIIPIGTYKEDTEFLATAEYDPVTLNADRTYAMNRICYLPIDDDGEGPNCKSEEVQGKFRIFNRKFLGIDEIKTFIKFYDQNNEPVDTFEYIYRPAEEQLCMLNINMPANIGWNLGTCYKRIDLDPTN